MPTEASNEPNVQVEKQQKPSIEEIQEELDEVRKQRAESEKKAADYFNRLQRLQADMENLQKMTKRQIDNVTRQASEKLLVRLLPILDALQQAEKIAHSSDSLPPEEISVGLKMLQEQLTEVLSDEGLEEIPAIGQTLDTDRHEVVSYLETEEKPENTIVEEIRKGYILNGKVIRQSLVVVAKPKLAQEKRLDNGVE